MIRASRFVCVRICVSLLLMVSLTAVADIVLDEQKLKASDAAVDDHFGRTIAISGDTALIQADSDDDGTNSGSVYVFVRIDGLWVEQAKLTASDATTYDNFGEGLAQSLHFRRSPREIASRQWSRVRAPRSPGHRMSACPLVSPRDLG